MEEKRVVRTARERGGRAGERFRELVESLDAIVWEADAETFQFSFVSQKAEQILGYPIERWLVERDFWAHLIHPDDRERTVAFCQAATSEGRDHKFEYRAVAADGRVVWLSDIVRVVTEDGGRARQLCGIMVDITERKRAEEERDNLASAVEQTAESVVITTVDGTIIYANPALERMTGYSAAEVLGRTPRLFKSGRYDQSFYERLWGIILAGQVWRGEVVNRRKDGSLFTVEHCITPVHDSHGTITHFVAVSEDVTARKELEARLRQSQKMEAIGRLAGGVAHDFNNLLTVIGGRGQILLSRLKPGDPLHREAAIIQKTVARAAGLTKQLLAFSRQQTLAPKALDLNSIVANVAAMLERLIGEDIHLVTEPGPGLWRVEADQVQMEQVIMNLAVNARDAMPQGGRLSIETSNVELGEATAGVPPGRYVLLTVGDTGHGMDAETLSRIFEPFFTTKEQGKGTGLGLATVYGIVQQSGGHIRVSSEPMRGTTFKIYVPRAKDAGEAVEPGRAPAEVSGGAETVLLAEDEDAVRDLARDILKAYGYAVLEARHGHEALGIAERHAGRIDLLLTDVVMPRMRGTELARQLASSRPEMKVLYMSGYSGEHVGRDEMTALANAFLQKPFTPEALALRVREILDGPGTGPGRRRDEIQA